MPPERPYIIRKDGTVEDRQTGERIGECCRDRLAPHLGRNRRRWVAVPVGETVGWTYGTRGEAVDALWRELEHRAESLRRRDRG